jgi:hypothetical protein
MLIDGAVSALNFASAAAAFVAAYYWYRAATLKVPYDPAKDDGSAGIISQEGDKMFDFFASGMAQSRASRKGAISAGFAAFAQGIALTVQAIAA